MPAIDKTEKIFQRVEDQLEKDGLLTKIKRSLIRPIIKRALSYIIDAVIDGYYISLDRKGFKTTLEGSIELIAKEQGKRINTRKYYNTMKIFSPKAVGYVFQVNFNSGKLKRFGYYFSVPKKIRTRIKKEMRTDKVYTIMDKL